MTDEDEVQRLYRLSDQMASMYSVLRDRTARKALALQLIVLASSFGLLVASLVPDAFLARFGLDPTASRDVILVLSALILFLSFIELKLDLRAQTSLYGDAAKRLYRLKAYIRALQINRPLRPVERASIRREYDKTMDALCGFPDGQFLGLKAAHLRKVRLSRFISRYPSHPHWLARARFALRDIRIGQVG